MNVWMKKIKSENTYSMSSITLNIIKGQGHTHTHAGRGLKDGAMLSASGDLLERTVRDKGEGELSVLFPINFCVLPESFYNKNEFIYYFYN